MRFVPVLVPALLLTCGVSWSFQNTNVPKPLPIPGADFETSIESWKIEDKMTSISTEQAASGKQSLKVVDASETEGSSATSSRVAVQGGHLYRLHGKAFPVSGEGLGIYVRVLDKDGQLAERQDEFQRGAPSTPTGQWNDFSFDVRVPENAAFLELWIHSYGKAKVVAYLDDFRFEDHGVGVTTPPFLGTYKIKPHETTRLTAADVIGPDGIVYPDWRYAGVPGGIPTVKVVAKVEEFGARANDDRDDADAVERGAQAVGNRGGGALLLGAGTYYLDRPILIKHDNVVLRGAGREATRVLFRYGAPEGGVGFYRPLPNDTVDSGTWIEAHADPNDLRSLKIAVDGEVISQTTYYPQHWGGTFSLRTSGQNVLAKAPMGEHQLQVIAGYAGGREIKKEIPIRTSNAAAAPARVPDQIAAIMFAGISRPGPQLKLARDGKRGERELLLQSALGLQAGDRIRLTAPATPHWNALVRNAAKWGNYRRYEFLVEKIDGNKVLLNQPLRLKFPLVDESFVQEITPMRRCGVEDFTLEQTREVWTSGIVFSNAWECWARGVMVKKAGRFPLYMLNAKWGEIRDCQMDDAWYKGGGGTAYVGWENACDGLMENIETWKMRHAPLVQWAASGNVIRNSVFHDSDGQWHSGWTNENLFENCVIESSSNNGAYGYGLWASPPEDEAHGPNGPRNVVYNCDISSPKAGLWMGGMNENWLILYNRFRVDSGPAVYAKDASFDHIIRGNVFQLKDDKQAAVVLRTPDCTGVEIVENEIWGGYSISAGAKPLLEQNNKMSLGAGALLGDRPRPRPTVPSIFAWQRAQKR